MLRSTRRLKSLYRTQTRNASPSPSTLISAWGRRQPAARPAGTSASTQRPNVTHPFRRQSPQIDVAPPPAGRTDTAGRRCDGRRRNSPPPVAREANEIAALTCRSDHQVKSTASGAIEQRSLCGIRARALVWADDRFRFGGDFEPAIGLATFQAPVQLPPNLCFATHSASLPRAADGCIARMMRKPNGARTPRCCFRRASGCWFATIWIVRASPAARSLRPIRASAPAPCRPAELHRSAPFSAGVFVSPAIRRLARFRWPGGRAPA